ncbi:gamma-glutamyl-gamma-aminobutyrate hydrolase family protein [Egicoccus halophilus]|uniref:Peptidase C26 n=1 Tax=Egicoccus halophilus TaxID=1670830 RepID=A0A8J3EYR9_9ACTN|nr:gamma-glutamyl-gamma-aminobutyrate hydrolase family protein [Egicoccus halophilus]GGI08446.1 peptidase C26 [Egicoccus halophilus]
MRPRIAITTWRRPLPTFVAERTLLHTLADEYVTCVRDVGGLPLLVPHVRGEQEADAVLDAVDGLLVAGGGDVDPASYGAANVASKDVDPEADTSELALLRCARRRRVPTLAICRGMQLAVVAAGGTLLQEIGRPGGVHEPISNDPDAVIGARHPVEVLDDTRLAAIFGAGTRTVNTIHHQAVDDLPAGLRVTAVAPDGVIEAVEPVDDPWPLLAVQWHPEKLEGADRMLFEAFVALARDAIRPVVAATP